MRIDRLPTENPRTQGSVRRAWYRRHCPTHPSACAALLDAALAACVGAPTHAVVLGAGACTELPLERIARACASVLLVDVDMPGMAVARAELPADLRGRVELVTADITGGVSRHLATELQRQPWVDLTRLGGPGSHTLLSAAASCLERCSVADPPEVAGLKSHDYRLVASSLVLTQLFSLPLLDVADALTLHAPAVADLREGFTRYREAAQTFRRRVVQAHLSLLGALLAPGGAGLLTTDVTGYLLPATHSGRQSSAAPEALVVLPPEVLAIPEDITTRFLLLQEPRQWRWVVSEPTSSLPGRSYDTVGVVFRQKASS